MASSTISSTGGPIYFFREFEEPYGFLSQWYASTFYTPAASSIGKDTPQVAFLTTEQYMMYQKAVLFKDQDIADKIMLQPEPKKQKALGRKVRNFVPKQWDKKKEQIVEDGNFWKFTQPKGEEMKGKLLATGNRELVEASPFDRIWGIGFAVDHAESNKGNWGENLLGKALMRVRARLRADSETS